MQCEPGTGAMAAVSDIVLAVHQAMSTYNGSDLGCSSNDCDLGCNDASISQVK